MIPLRFLLAPTLFVAGGLAACSKVEVAAQAPQSVDLAVVGMTCTACEDTICSSLRELPGVESCVAHFESGQVSVVYLPNTTDETRIADTIRSAGFEVPKKP